MYIFTKLKTIWEELSNYKPVCTCGDVKNLNSHYQMEYIMSFLMGLNDSFAQVRGQLLLMDPLLPINKAFSLISQEEHQKKIGSHINVGSNSTGTMAFAVKTDNSKASGGYKGQKKDRPFCTHCNFHCHAIDKCYKIHGYSPGYKPKPRNNYTYSNNNTVVNQVSNQLFSNSTVKTDELGSVGDFIQNLNPN